MGSVSSRLFDWRDELIEISSYLETSIDFSDEELPANTISSFKKKLDKIKENLLVAIEKAEFSKKIKNPKNFLGGKGANLSQMGRMGLPVPPGFTISTKVCDIFYKNNKQLNKQLIKEINKAIINQSN